MTKPLKIGLVGCGNIAQTYLNNAQYFKDDFVIVAVADIDAKAADTIATRYGLVSRPPAELVADPDIEAVLNLTIPAAHIPVALAAIEAGKHVYLEKPIGTNAAEARRMLARAAEKKVLVGAAPDTFLGAGHQTAKRLIESGAIGTIVGGSAAVIDRGMEDWHPNPASFFTTGGGPVFDMGPYYLSSLVNLLGPAKAVASFASIGLKERVIGTGPKLGEPISIQVPTTVNAVLRFGGDIDIAFTASWDVWSHRRNHIEIYGSEGTIILPDPNWFGGAVELSVRGGPFQPVFDESLPFGTALRVLGDGSSVADYRGAGLAEMARAIKTGSAYRAHGAFAMHILSIMEALHKAAAERRVLAIE